MTSCLGVRSFRADASTVAERELPWVVGLPFRDLTKDEYHGWTFSFGGGCQLHASAHWRIIVGEKVALTPADHGQQFGMPAPVDADAEARGLLAGASIAQATLDESLGDLRLTFSNGAQLQVFNDSSGYESWELVGPARALIVACGGDGAAIWPPEP